MKMNFYQPGGIRSLSKIHQNPYKIIIEGKEFGVNYQPGDSKFRFIWRELQLAWACLDADELSDNPGPKAISRYYKDQFQVEFPTGSGKQMMLDEISNELAKRLVSIFQRGQNGARRVNGNEEFYQSDPNFKDLVLLDEYFHGDTLRGVGASHQTGWTGAVAELINRISRFHPTYEEKESELQERTT